MGKRAEVYAALKAKAEAVAAAMSLQITDSDDNFEPPIDGNGMILPYLRYDAAPNAPFWEGIASGRVDQGLTTIMIVMPRPHVLATAWGYIDALIDAYPKASHIAGYPSLKVQSAPYDSQPLTESDRTYYPVTVSWVC